MISNFFWAIFHPLKLLNGILLNLGGGSKLLGFIFLIIIIVICYKIGLLKLISKIFISFKKLLFITYSYILFKRTHLDRNVYGVHNCKWCGENGIVFQTSNKINDKMVQHPFIVKFILNKIYKIKGFISGIISYIISI